MLVEHIGMPQLRDMAKRSEEIAGEIRLADLPRLAGMLHPETAARESNSNATFIK